MYRKCLKIFDLIYLSLDVLNREWIASAVIGMLQRKVSYGRSPGLVVMGRDSRSKGLGFESRHHKLDGHFFISIFCKIL